ncbi:MAG: cytochrome-c oxidase, cbb3-type subunit III [Rhodospirillaceae bacterium]|nr:cytochrome-c oxidase, cbb3-type subunit III [Rhodospirillaceae bacterium]
MAEIEKDAVSGRETTGHEWDGIKELNTPLPRWWLYTFYVCILWAVGYWIVYPAWPTLSGYTKGVIGYSSRGELRKELAARDKSRTVWTDRFSALSVGGIAKDSELLNYAMAGGRVIFAENCAPCHGASGSGNASYPVLADDDWLWGGTVGDIYTTINYGIRSTHDDTRLGEMPNFGDEDMLAKAQISDVTEYVLSLSGNSSDRDAAMRGTEIFAEECSSCHGESAEGVQDMGAPRLSDGIWLYGNSKEKIMSQISTPKHGSMPAWNGRLDDISIKQVSIYVHSLGGGQQ